MPPSDVVLNVRESYNLLKDYEVSNRALLGVYKMINIENEHWNIIVTPRACISNIPTQFDGIVSDIC